MDQIPKTELGRLYAQHIAVVGNLSLNPSGNFEADAEKMLNHMGIAEGIVGAAFTIFDAETFEIFKRDTGFDRAPDRLADVIKFAVQDLAPLP